MADLGAAIVIRLEAHSAFWSAVSGGVDWTVSLPDTPFPHAVATIISRDRPDHYEGPDLAGARLQLDIYSIVSAGQAADIAELAIEALQPGDDAGGFRFERAGDVDGPNDTGDQTDTVYIYRSRVDFELMYAPLVGEVPPVENGTLWEVIQW